MASKFILTAETVLTGPTNVRQFIADLNRSVGNVNINVGLHVKQNDIKKLQDVQKTLTTVDKALEKTNKQTKKVTDTFEDFGRQAAISVKRFGVFVLATAAIRDLISSVNSGVRSAITFQDELVKIAQVTGSATKDLQSLRREISDLSISLGVSSNNLLNASQILAQAGYNAQQTEKALKALAKVELAPTFSPDAIKNAEALVAISAQFKIPVTDAEKAFSAINQVSKRFAIESSDVVTAVKRTGGAFAAAGGDLNDFLGLFTSVRATTRESAETIATGFRTIFTRLQRPRTLNFLDNLGISLRDSQGLFVKPFEAIQRLSEALKGIPTTDPRFAQIVEELGGFRQVSKVIPLIQEFTLAERARQVALTGTASLEEDAIRRQESLIVSFTRVKEELFALIRAFGDQTEVKLFIKSVLNLASAFIKVADSVRQLAPYLAVFAAFKSVGAGASLYQGFTGKFFTPELPGYASGGYIPGTGNKDSYLAKLMPGEFVVNKRAARELGPRNLAALNQGLLPHFANGTPTKNIFSNPAATAITLSLTANVINNLAQSNKALTDESRKLIEVFSEFTAKFGLYTAFFSYSGKKTSGIQDFSAQIPDESVNKFLFSYGRPSQKYDENLSRGIEKAISVLPQSVVDFLVKNDVSVSTGNLLTDLPEFRKLQGKRGEIGQRPLSYGIARGKNIGIASFGKSNSKYIENKAVAGTLLHEFGHVITNIAKLNDIPSIRKAYVQDRKALAADPELEKRLEYFTENNIHKGTLDRGLNEAIAESIARTYLVTGGNPSQPFQKGFGNTMQAVHQALIDLGIDDLSETINSFDKKVTEVKEEIATFDPPTDKKQTQKKPKTSGSGGGKKPPTPPVTTGGTGDDDFTYDPKDGDHPRYPRKDGETDKQYNARVRKNLKSRETTAKKKAEKEALAKAEADRKLEEERLEAERKAKLEAEELRRKEEEKRQKKAEQQRKRFEKQLIHGVDNQKPISPAAVKYTRERSDFFLKTIEDQYGVSGLTGKSFTEALNFAKQDPTLSQNPELLKILEGFDYVAGEPFDKRQESAQARKALRSNLRRRSAQFNRKLLEQFTDERYQTIPNRQARIRYKIDPLNKVNPQDVNISDVTQDPSKIENTELVKRRKKQEAIIQRGIKVATEAELTREKYDAIYRENPEFRKTGVRLASTYISNNQTYDITDEDRKQLELAARRDRARRKREFKVEQDNKAQERILQEKRFNKRAVERRENRFNVTEFEDDLLLTDPSIRLSRKSRTSRRLKDKINSVIFNKYPVNGPPIPPSNNNGYFRRAGRFYGRNQHIINPLLFAAADTAGSQLSQYGYNNINKGIAGGVNQAAAGGGLAGAARGAALGSAFGAQGLAIGALVGGIVGYTNELVNAQSRLEKVKFDEAFGKIKKQLDGFDNGLKPAIGAVTDVSRAMTLLEDRINKTSGEDQITAKGELSNSIVTFTSIFQKTAEKSLDIDSFINLVGRDSIERFARLTNQSVDTIVDGYQKQIDAQNKGIVAQNALSKSNREYFSRISSIQNLVSAISKTSIELSKFQDALSFGATQTRENNFESLQNLSVDNIRNLSSFGASGFANDLLYARDISKAIPSILSSIVVDPLNREGDGQDIISNIRTQAANAAGLPVTSRLLDPLVNAVRNSIGPSGDASQFLQSLISNFDQTVEQLRSGLSDLLPIFKELSTVVKSAKESYTQSLQSLSDFNNEISQRTLKVADVLSSFADFSSSFKNSDSSYGIQKQIDEQRLRTVTKGLNPFGVVNPNIFGDQLVRSQQNISRLNEQIQTADRNQIQALIQERQKELDTVRDVTTALEFLSDASSRTANAQKELSRLESLRANRSGFASDFAFGSNESRSQTVRAIRNARLAQAQGNLAGFSNESKQQIAEILKQFSDDRLFNGKTGNELLKILTAGEFRRAGLNPKDAGLVAGLGKTAPEVQLGKEISDGFKTSVAALNALNKAQQTTLDRLISINETGFRDLITSIEGQFGKAEREGVDNRIAELNTQIGQSLNQRKLLENFNQQFGITDITQGKAILSKSVGLRDVLSKQGAFQSSKQNILGLLEGGITPEELVQIRTQLSGLVSQNEIDNLQKVGQRAFDTNSYFNRPSYISDGKLKVGLPDLNTQGQRDLNQQTLQQYTRILLSSVRTDLESQKLEQEKGLRESGVKGELIPLLGNEQEVKKLEQIFSGFNEDNITQLNQKLSELTTELHNLKIQQVQQGQGFAVGGIVPGVGNKDSVPARLMPGEYVLNKKTVNRVGVPFLHRLNSHGNGFAEGGSVGYNNISINSTEFERSIRQFSQTSNALALSMDNFPREISHTINGRVEVVLNGAEVLSRISEPLQQLIEAKVADGINKFTKNKFPDLK